MTLNDYQEIAQTTAIYPPPLALHYLIPALIVEVDELQRASAAEDGRDDVLDEAGDVLWMLALLAVELDLELQAVYDCTSLADLDATSLHRLTFALQIVWVKVVRDYSGDLRAYWATENPLLDAHGWMATMSMALHALEAVAQTHEASLELLSQRNLAKLASRAERGMLGGAGDHR